eukprot:c35774_g1_i1 orf=180-386(-)
MSSNYGTIIWAYVYELLWFLALHRGSPLVLNLRAYMYRLLLVLSFLSFSLFCKVSTRPLLDLARHTPG